MKTKNISEFKDLKFGKDYLLKVVTTDYKTRKEVVIPDDLPKYNIDKDSFKVSKALAMSACLPIVYSIYEYQSYKFIDGGATNKFPIDLLSSSKNPIIGLKIGKENHIIKSFQGKVFQSPNYQVKDGKVFIIKIDTLGLRASQFSKGLDNKEDLYKAGYLSVKNYFRNL
mgnify:CR=1 FL=1